MNFNNDEKDVLFVSLNAIIKKIAENNNSQFNLRYKLNDILKEYDEEYIWDAVFLIKPIVEAHSKLNG